MGKCTISLLKHALAIFDFAAAKTFPISQRKRKKIHIFSEGLGPKLMRERDENFYHYVLILCAVGWCPGLLFEKFGDKIIFLLSTGVLDFKA